MKFKTKDLMVHVLPQTELSKEDIEKLCLMKTHICIANTFYPPCPPGTLCLFGTCLPCTQWHPVTFPCILGCTRATCAGGPTCVLCTQHGTPCPGCTHICTQIGPTCPGCSYICSVNHTPICPGCTLPGTIPVAGPCEGGSVDPGPWVIRDPGDLVKLREELQNTLAKLKEIEDKNLLSPITSPEHADQVEAALNEAAKQVRDMKSKLKVKK
jgi:hypothetical protein